MLHYFSELPLDDLKGALVLLDIDGTILPDGELALDRAVLAAIARLKRRNRVMICSNNGSPDRLRAVAQAAGVPIVETVYKKPHRRVLESIQRDADQLVVVIGDKYLTDERFAAAAEARFIRVRRLQSPQDRWAVKLAYIIDDSAYFVSRLFRRPARVESE